MKNIVLIITDTFRYDNLSAKAKRPVQTPQLDKFAFERAASIEKFYAGSFPTIPHRTDLASGVLGWPRYGWQPIRKSSPKHIATLLGQRGYISQLICDCPHLFPAEIQHAFDAAFQHRGQEGDRPLLHLNDPIRCVMPVKKTRRTPLFRGHPLVDVHRWSNRYFRSEKETFAAKTSKTTVCWLEENYEADPFFLWVDFFDPHEPWDPPEYFVQRYDPNYVGTGMLHPNYGHSSDYTSEELRNLWAHYAAESEVVDRYIGRILQKIDDLQLWDTTIVIVTSDHGISLGEHHRTGKSNRNPQDERYWPIYPEIGHVPFLIAGGDIKKGISLDLTAQPIDILPTLCELADVSAGPMEASQGKSFADALLDGTRVHRKYVVSGRYIPGMRLPRRSETPFLVTERWGYAPMGANGRPELYDLTKDPLAENDIPGHNGKVIEKLHRLFLVHLQEYGAASEFMELWKSK